MTHTHKNDRLGRLLAALLALAGPSAWAEDGAALQASEPHDRIIRAARDFLSQQLEERSAKTSITVGNIDRRLRLAHCDRRLEGYLAPGGRLIGNVSIGVRCNGSHPWKLYVQARVSLTEDVMVAKDFIARGEPLTPGRFVIETRDVTDAIRGYLTAADQVAGMVARQPIQAGQLLSPGMLKKPLLIRRGDQVDIVSRAGAMEVRMRGSALGDGCEGDRIKVRNGNSRRVIEGLVSKDGLVVVQM
jgi:flagella basal body P-ring formation protein FlgA